MREQGEERALWRSWGEGAGGHATVLLSNNLSIDRLPNLERQCLSYEGEAGGGGWRKGASKGAREG